MFPPDSDGGVGGGVSAGLVSGLNLGASDVGEAETGILFVTKIVEVAAALPSDSPPIERLIVTVGPGACGFGGFVVSLEIMVLQGGNGYWIGGVVRV